MLLTTEEDSALLDLLEEDSWSTLGEEEEEEEEDEDEGDDEEDSETGSCLVVDVPDVSGLGGVLDVSTWPGVVAGALEEVATGP